MTTIRRWLGPLAWSLVLTSGAVATAQGVGGAFDPPSVPGVDPGAGSGWMTWPVKAAILGVLAVTAWVAGFFWFFPMRLKKSKPDWPLDAFGLTAALIWLGVWALALAIFWDDLVLDLKVGSGVVGEYGLRGALASMAIVGALLFRGLYRSQRPATSAAP